MLKPDSMPSTTLAWDISGRVTHPEVQRKALFDFPLQTVRLDEPIAVRCLAALDAARMHHAIAVKPAR